MEAKPYLPLSSYRDPHSFKVFVNDVGLLSAMSGLEAETLLKGSDIFVEFKGALTEQFVFQQLLQNKALYYWSKDNSRQEVDFIIQSDNQVVPIECKAEENLKAKSLASFIKEHGVSKAYKISMKPYQKSDDIVINVPLYMAAEI
ncbi:MAG: DUF4143 domain-containing protein [Paludibacteraceae bacterium]|nr:DUF4143 domain-containing protein [Paludibacteraceae bacterium]